MLVAAGYDGGTLTLSFDRAIDIAGLNGSQVGVDDSQFNIGRYVATGAVTLLGPTQVRIRLTFVEPFGDPYGVFLNATGASGIVAVDDGGAWAGASELELPFP